VVPPTADADQLSSRPS